MSLPANKDVNRLAEPMGSLMRYGMVLGRKQGKSVTLTSGLRTREQQIDLRRQHCGTSQYQIYEAPSSACRPYTARPGTSKHETGKAADMGGDKEWLAAQMRPFDVDRRVPGEDWHFQYYGNDPAGTLAKLDQAMTRNGFTSAERAEVRGNGLSFEPGLGQGSSGGIGAGGGSFGDTSGLGGGSGGGLGSLVSLAGLLTRPITDGDFRRRMLLVAGGAILIYAAGNLLAKDLLTEALNG